MADYIPVKPAYETQAEVWTFQDAIDHILDSEGMDNTALNIRQAKRAVLRAYRDLPNRHRWSYFKRGFGFFTAAKQTTGTIAFDLTGGTYERMVTLSAATWPTDAKDYRIVISDIHYPIEAYKSSTQITLHEHERPSADVAAATSYTLYKSNYKLPNGFRKVNQVYDATGDYALTRMGSSTQRAQEVYYSAPSTPVGYDLRNTGDYYGTTEVVLSPPPSAERTYDMIVELSPRPLYNVRKTDTCQTSGTTVTLATSGKLDVTRDVGAIMRFPASTVTTTPTSIVGGPAGVSAYDEQRTIVAIASGTSCTIDSALPSNLGSGTACTVEDPLDLDYSTMLTYFLRLAEAEFARITRRQDRRDLEEAAAMELVLAAAADQKSTAVGGKGMQLAPFHLRQWSSIPDEIVNAG